MLSVKEIYEILREVKLDGGDLVSLGYVMNVSVEGKHVHINLKLPEKLSPKREEIYRSIQDRFRSKDVHDIKVDFRIERASPKPPGGFRIQQNIFSPQSIPGVKRIVAVGSGKGGVGKSTVAVNLAIKLSQLGYSVALFDADIYGPSVGSLLNLSTSKIRIGKDGRFLPVEAYGIKVISFASMLDEDTPVIWRGTMYHKIYQDLFFNTLWEDVDYLVIDFPPGTGDAQISAAQIAKMDGALVVTTPQKVSLNDVRRAINAFLKLKVPVVGIVENMSYLIDTCSKKIHVFGEGGGRLLSEMFNIPLVCQIPLDPEYMELSDQGIPMMIREPKNRSQKEIHDAYEKLAKFVLDRIPIRLQG